ncbi:MAG TPA: glycoside hydrolase family 88 protein [Opitutaceae bacterium]|nr:glycoside hydrolase family 88 protein [Opitutaceae bacterium]
MKSSFLFPFRPLAALTLAVVSIIANSAFAEGPYRARDNPSPNNDPYEGHYPIPYGPPQPAEIADVMARVRNFLEQAMPARVVDRSSGKSISDFASPIQTAGADLGENGRFNPLAYEMGVIHSGMLAATAATGDKDYANFTARQLQFLVDRFPYFRSQAEKFGMKQNSFRSVFEPEALDDAGAMCAALIRARLAGVGPDLKLWIDRWSAFISKEQFRLTDGTLARHRPQPESLWCDDLYMSVPALVQMSRLTGDHAWLEDAVKQARHFTDQLFDPRVGLYMHGKNLNQPDNPEYYWARANGWVVLATCDLLDELPADHPDRSALLATLRTHLKSLAKLQSPNGLWHQMLDKPDSFLETSASAMFVYGFSHAIDRGWISPISYAAVAVAGWNALSTQVNARGQVEGTCVGTTFGGELIFYYNRPQSPYAMHGYGPFLLAGSEMTRLVQNPAFRIIYKDNTYQIEQRK